MDSQNKKEQINSFRNKATETAVVAKDMGTKTIKAGVLRVKWLILGIVIGAIICFLVTSSIYNEGKNAAHNTEEPVSVDVITIQQRLDRCAELASATYTYTNADVFSEENIFFGTFDIPGFTGKYFVMKYDGIIKAGINMDEVKIEPDGTVIKVTLPNPVILSHELDEDSFEIIKEQDTVFTPFKPDDQSVFRSEQKSKMEQAAKENGLFEEATNNAETSIRAIIESSIPEGYSVEFVRASEG